MSVTTVALSGADQVAQQAIWAGALLVAVIVVCVTIYKVMTWVRPS